MKALPCLVCGKPLEDASGGFPVNQPYGGLGLVTYGAYGSTVFDPMNGTYLSFSVCDECLVEGAKAGAVGVGCDSVQILAEVDGYLCVVGRMSAHFHTRKWDGESLPSAFGESVTLTHQQIVDRMNDDDIHIQPHIIDYVKKELQDV